MLCLQFAQWQQWILHIDPHMNHRVGFSRNPCIYGGLLYLARNQLAKGIARIVLMLASEHSGVGGPSEVMLEWTESNEAAYPILYTYSCACYDKVNYIHLLKPFFCECIHGARIVSPILLSGVETLATGISQCCERGSEGI